MMVANKKLPAGATEPASRLSICYVAPGQYLLPTAGPTRNVLNLATALARYADVTVAFRRDLDKAGRHGLDVLEIDPPAASAVETVPDDAAVRGVSIAEFARYTRALRRFVRRELGRFDIVFEKSWTLSGLVSAECAKVDVPAIVVENLVPVVGDKAAAGPVKRAKILAGKAVAGRYLRKANRIIAETRILRSAMAEQWRIPDQRISVVALGVDRALFAPSEQAMARSEVGIAPEATVLLYSGVLDRTHDLRPVIAAMAQATPHHTELHVIGDGTLRAELESLAADHRVAVRFHGRVPYETVPRYISAADLCLAPYEPTAFPGGQVAYSSLKIPEYMSVGRPVVSVPSGRVLELIEDGVTGFLFANETGAWTRFLNELPGRERLAVMGASALESGLDSWDDVARAYLEIGRMEIAAARGRRAH